MAPLPVWKRTSKWKPASPGGGSRGFSVECPDTSELGHCKPVQYSPEVLASALAREVEVSVPDTELANCEDQTVAVSKSFGEKSMDVRELKIVSPEAYSSDDFKAAARKASGLLPFHAWVGTGDLKDDHVVIRQNGREYELAGVDFADAFGFDATGGDVRAPQGPPVLLEHRDQDVMRDTIRRIGAVPDQRIQELVGSLPDDALTPADKERITEGLIARKGRIEPTFHSAGWLT